ncbi:unnamed protein product [Moneuplotes crassus]|uniref:Uncharacterized protein n=1 Tax=Euplotes crassus TaxID=5936 RepID=A0AAD1XPH3_EUPCR|nr:unnamed protein product [Moneuplotes crassus]
MSQKEDEIIEIEDQDSKEPTQIDSVQVELSDETQDAALKDENLGTSLQKETPIDLNDEETEDQENSPNSQEAERDEEDNGSQGSEGEDDNAYNDEENGTEKEVIAIDDQSQDDVKENEEEDQEMEEEDDTNPRWVSIHSTEYKKFIQKIELNWESNSTKLSVCLLCWGFLSFNLKKKHMEHSHYTLTPSFVKNEEMFLKLAKKHKRMSDDEQNVQIFAEKCKVINYSAPVYGAKKETKSSTQSLYVLCNKQIESESIIKRMSLMVNKLYEESNSKDNRILELQQELDRIKAELTDIQKKYDHFSGKAKQMQLS